MPDPVKPVDNLAAGPGHRLDRAKTRDPMEEPRSFDPVKPPANAPEPAERVADGG